MHKKTGRMNLLKLLSLHLDSDPSIVPFVNKLMHDVAPQLKEKMKSWIFGILIGEKIP